MYHQPCGVAMYTGTATKVFSVGRVSSRTVELCVESHAGTRHASMDVGWSQLVGMVPALSDPRQVFLYALLLKQARGKRRVHVTRG